MSPSIGFWSKLAIVIILLFIIDVIVVFVGALSDFWMGSTMKLTFSNLLFIEGILIAGIGAVIASGYTTWRTNLSTVLADPAVYEEYMREQRRKQTRFGLTLMAIGAVLAVLAMAVYYTV